MTVTVLGCNGPYPAPGGATTGYLISAGKAKILLDCGSGVLSRLMGICDPQDISCILLSHMHYDHMADMPVLGYYFEVNGGMKDIYIPAEEKSEKRNMISGLVYHIHDLPDEGCIEGIRISTLPVRHPVPCRAIRLEYDGRVFVYTGDTNECPELTAFCRDADVLLADSAFTDAQWADTKPHMSAGICGKLAAEAHVRRLYLTHMNPRNDKALLTQEAERGYKLSGGQDAQIDAVHTGMIITV